MRLLARVLCLCTVFVAASANAATTPTATHRLREIERGVWVGSNVGAAVYLKTPGENGGTSPGAIVGFELGYDVADWLQVGALVWGQAIGADADYEGIADPAEDPKGARGDFQSAMVGGSLRLGLARFADANGLARTWLYARLGGGWSTSRPKGIVADAPFALGGLGVEYFTQLRHFSVGLEVGGLGLLTEEEPALAVTILPNLKYTF